MNGLEVLKKIKDNFEYPPPVLIISDSGEINTVVKAIKLGADDYIQKDFNIEILTEKITKALERNQLNRKVEHLNKLVDDQRDKFIFASRQMQVIDEQITRLANIECDVLIKGETGVGKDLLAYELHKRSKRSSGIFISLPIASLSDNLIESELFGYEKGAFTGADKSRIGKLESANFGTLYLPEISSINEKVQLKLLQFMQYKTIAKVGQSGSNEYKLNVRIIAATNDNLDELIKQNKMRSDFYYRIDQVSIHIPPLRERKEDIIPLAEYFINKHALKLLGRNLELDKSAVKLLEQFDWPGNVRQLENTIIKALAIVDEKDESLSSEHFDSISQNNKSGLTDDSHYENAKREFRIKYFKEVLEKANGNLTKAAEYSGISRNGLDKALKELGIK
jgi:DNA-binding NtrC family response regulator